MNVYGRNALALACLALVPAMPVRALAQHWEMTAGLPAQRESHAGTKEVRVCAGAGGVISVGTANPGGAPANTNLLIERLSTLATIAAPGFRFEYDSAGRPERGAQVVELRDGTGFAVVGSLDAAGTGAALSNFIVTKINCIGAPQWRFSYGDTTDQHTGFDILQTTSGNSAFSTQPGDLVALGKYFRPAGGGVAAIHRVRIARTRVNGTPVWVRDYQPSLTGDLELRAISELAPIAPGTTGDLVAVGRIDGDAAVMQVDGNTGALVCTARTRGLGTAQYNDVVAVRTLAGTPEYLTVGQTSPVGAAPQVYLSRFLPNCLLRVHTHWGSSADREVANGADLTGATTFAGAPAGVLMLGGEVDGTFGGAFSQDAFLHLAHPQTLLPYVLATGAPVIGRRYGTQGPLAEKAFSVVAGSNGAYFAGSTATDWAGTGDPLQALTARVSDVGFKTQCSVDWVPPAVNLAISSSTFAVTVLQKGGTAMALPARVARPAQQPCCAIVP